MTMCFFPLIKYWENSLMLKSRNVFSLKSVYPEQYARLNIL